MKPKSKCSCIHCHKEITTNNIDKHFKSKMCVLGKTQAPKMFPAGLTICPFCVKQHKNHNSLCQHAIRCSKNPNKIEGFDFPSWNKVNIRWNKGKTKETDSRIAKQAKTRSDNIKSGKIVISTKPKFTPKAIKKLSDLAIARGLGGLGGRSKRTEYNGNLLGSSYELTVAKSLDRYNISWEIPKRVNYVDLNGKKRSYTPDFFLPDFNVYLDPKNDFLLGNINPALGFKDTDKIKWAEEQNGIKVLVLNKDQLDWPAIKCLL